MKKISKQISAIILSLIMIMGAMPMSAFAAQENTDKEEVVYVSLNSDGCVKEINVVNVFDLDKDGKIIDYGEYEKVRNMTTTDNINSNGDQITVDAKKGKLYYEGKLKSNEIPWLISIKYYLDGNEYSAKNIAGKSGKIEIKMSIKQNKKCDKSFFEGYALQATFTLDTDKATNIVADGATVANVGSDKQITYTILPNNEKDISIYANVDNFEMDAVAINAIRMNLDIDADTEKLQDKIDEVIKATNDLDDGAGKVNDASSEIYGATGKLNSATKEFQSGVKSLSSAANELSSGLNTLSSKNKELTSAAWSAYEGLCTAAQTQLNEQLSANGLEKVTLTPKNYSTVLQNVMAQMNADSVYSKAYNTALAKVTSQVNAQADTLYKEYINSQADAIYLEYVKSQSDLLYTQVATQAVINQLVENGYTKEQATAYVQTNEGKILVANAVAVMTDEQKEQVLYSAVQSLTSEQKKQILDGAYSSLTDEQKMQIKDAYIKQLMASDDVTSQITAAVKKASSAAGEVAKLKGQLDSYGAFYNGLVDYTNAVSSAATGANALSNGLSNLNLNTKTLADSVGKLNIAMGKLNDGTSDLKNGTSEFASEVKDADSKLDDEIDSELSSLTGKDVETKSFVSSKNKNIKSVQFVIKGENIAIESVDEKQVEVTENLSFWQKLINLFKFSRKS